VRGNGKGGRELFEAWSADGTIIRGLRWPGLGETIVLIHGAAMDTRVWPESGFVAALAGADVIALDLRGRGHSQHVSSAEYHALDRYVEDVRTVLDLFPRERHSVFGSYVGGRIALQTAAADARVVRAFSFCAHGEGVHIPDEAIEQEASAIGAPDGRDYLRGHFTAAGAPPWMVAACDRVDLGELAAVTLGLRYGWGRGVEHRHPGQELVLITASGDPELATYRTSEERLGAQLWLVESPSRVRAAERLGEVGRRVAGTLSTAPDAVPSIGTADR
jgi:pimeloyl-ACP methyl ester carboxylesterase